MLTKQQLAKQLLEIKAVQIQPDRPFKWTSGIQSPVYCDNRLTMSFPVLRGAIADSFTTYIKEHYPMAEVVVGCATAGIPHAAWVAERLQLPMAYVRSEPKGHGKQNKIEGNLLESQHCVIIEDLISTGKSSIAVADSIVEAGGIVDGVLSIFSYELSEGREAFKQSGYPYYSMTDFPTMLEWMKDEGRINDETLATLLGWMESPRSFSFNY
ncbi:orotate phosphoribosyltransferase [Pontibacillus halophilus JSM 076056 = DSM 19796]|uniref:Orotate phosphoribosyltransferase n=1 Tax=Pontibacillus halophilus JSM 076056 = DSM 19796 TaxID=1385510 RepID=A0A0A5IBL5_9BACI|nr:orotate phosphoribosyltransferase [Pontibacillus halophilus]KGX93232.1 orotate phosphoribosyltransferase [Pontibacillus halophilus JSM 076056 = DSM 19796]